MKVEAERLREQLDGAGACGDEVRQHVLALFGFAQDAGQNWRASVKDAWRVILGRVLSKRSLSDVSLVTTKRKPFDILAERPSFVDGRGDWPLFERAVARFVDGLSLSTAHLAPLLRLTA